METFLTELNKDNFESLHAFRNEPRFIENCTSRKKLESLAEFDKELEEDFNRDRLVQFLVLNYRKETIGTVYAYDFNSYDKFTFITTFITEGEKNKSYGIKAFLILADYLFKNYNLYKIYFDVYEFNLEMLSVLNKCNFSIEGRFRKQKLKNSKRYDVLRFAFYQEDSQTWTEKLKVTTANIV